MNPSMDRITLDEWIRELQLIKDYTPQNMEQTLQRRNNIENYEKRIEDMIHPDNETLSIEDWRVANTAIQNDEQGAAAAAATTASSILRTPLPKLPGIQNQGKRRRVEQTDFIMIRRPIFSQYEKEIFSDAKKNFLGLTGPQGFGKSVFLHYLATKRAFGGDQIVVLVPNCSDLAVERDFKKGLATAFYKGCAAHGFTDIPFMKYSDGVGISLEKMSQFVGVKDKRLLVIVDQMKLSLDYFAEAVKAMQSFAATATTGHFFILSSSTSGSPTPVFGDACVGLGPYDHEVTLDEVDLLSNGTNALSHNVQLLRTSNTSFLQTMEILEARQEISVPVLAGRFVNKLKASLDASSPVIANEARAEYMKVLIAIGAKDEFDHAEECTFRDDLVDGDKLYIKKNENGKYIMKAYMDGFAELVLKRLRDSEIAEYERLLLAIVGTPAFSCLGPWAQGIIMEDCFNFILEDEQNDVLFGLQPLLPGATVNLSSLSIKKRHVFKFATTPGSIDSWNPNERPHFIGVPPRGFMGIDFIVAWVTKTGTAGRKSVVLYVAFIQCTISPPEKHNILPNQYDTWVDILQKAAEAAGVKLNGTRKRVIFLTPRFGAGRKPTICAFSNHECIHSYFQSVKGNHPLIEGIKRSCGLEPSWDRLP